MLRHAVLAVGLGLLLAGCGPYGRRHTKAAAPTLSPTANSRAFTGTLSGTITAPECGGAYNLDNAAVEVRDEHDTVIGTDTARAIEIAGTVYGPGHFQRGHCRATFSVNGLPKSRVYRITVGTRSGPTYSYEELAAKGWVIVVSFE